MPEAVVIDHVKWVSGQHAAEDREWQQCQKDHRRGRDQARRHPNEADRGSESKPRIQCLDFIIREARESLSFDPLSFCRKFRHVYYPAEVTETGTPLETMS